jgi:protein-disulfide isomerase
VFLSQDEKQYIWGYAVDLTVDPDEMRERNLNLNNVRSKGSASAPVTIVEFTDMQCPFCKNVHDILKKDLYSSYTTNDVRLVFKHFPLSNHAWAEKAAIAAECAGEQKQEAFWKMTDSIFADSVSISTANIQGKVQGFAKASGINMDSFNQCYESQKPLAKVQYDRREGGMVGVNSTPTLFINGRMLRGIRSFEDVKVVIDEKRKEAAKKK